jgi:hypothetical protein
MAFSHPYYIESEKKDYTNCVGQGKFCAEPMAGYTATAADIINENIRQMCVYKEHRAESENLYWKYMQKYKEWCIDTLDFSKVCSESVLDKYMPTDSEKIKICVEKSFKDDNKTNNAILEATQRDFRSGYELHLFPSILVNNRTFMSSWTSINLLEAVCSGVISKPNICFEAGVFQKKKIESSGGLSVLSVFLIIILILAVNAVIYLLCRRYISKSISDRVSSEDIDARINNVVSSYIQFKDQSKLLDGQTTK